MYELQSNYHMDPLEISLGNDLSGKTVINIYEPYSDETITLDVMAAVKLVSVLQELIKRIGE